MAINSGEQGATTLRYVLFSTPENVRNTLTSLRSDLNENGLHICPGDMWELVVAEVLNNIVEHAYGDSPDGEIKLNLHFSDLHLTAKFIDSGAAMPDGALPAGNPANLDVETQLLPEGGFGWNLIHSLSDRLVYERRGTENHLDLEMPIQILPKG
ncbi:ATP-binding protein [Pelagimonas varians]|uniref:Serine-protein kinase RsbW n=1 Tax=Pelagimonas varians TaxID=696760 RepID=A0A238K3B3_9RHOB|nr:ATP-binding protein [Pelagimonas varians]PYG30520.1 serine/threonine-protein kinase RsbW [Pelagimonas varians]SMX37389.1 serine-protein kinase RsbW [Pelagimonas varians]